MKNSPIPYGKQFILEEDVQAVVDVLRSDYLTQGPKVQEFEESFARYVGAKYAVAVSNGTTALHLSAKALGVEEGDRVITTPITFVASANCVLYCGGDVLFSDIDPENYCLDPNKVEDLLRKSHGKVKGIIPVDFAGYPVDMAPFRTLAEKYGTWIIEDACHAPGAFRSKDSVVHRVGDGKNSDLTVFSFHPVKHIACGEGGMITTNSEDLYKKLILLRTHGITKDSSKLHKVVGGWYYEMQELGYNYRIPDILCALGISQLKRADISFQKRQKIAERYIKELQGLPLTLPRVENYVTHGYHLFVIQTSERKRLFDYLASKKIYCQVHYIPVHQQPYYIERYGIQNFEIADFYYERCLSLPMYHAMTFEEQTRVIEEIKGFF